MIQEKTRQIFGNQRVSNLSIKHFIGLAHSLERQDKTEEARIIASLAAAKLNEENKEIRFLEFALKLAKLFVELERPGEALISLNGFASFISKVKQHLTANYYEILGASYLELGFHLLAQTLLRQALDEYIEIRDYEAWYETASNLFMSYLRSDKRGEASVLLTRMLEILDKVFTNPFRDDLFPVAFYLFNQLFWSSLQANEWPKITSNEKILIRNMMKMLKRIIKKGDLRFIHFIDFDRVLATMITAGYREETEEAIKELLNLVAEDADERAAVLLKWMGVLHLTGSQEQESRIWKQIQELLPQIKEKSIQNAIATFQLRENDKA